MKRVMLTVVAIAVAIGLVRNIAAAPGAGVAGLIVFVLLVYLARRAWPTVRGDLAHVRPSLPRWRGRHGGGLL